MNLSKVKLCKSHHFYKKYQHSQYKINFIRIIINFIFILYKFGIVDFEDYNGIQKSKREGLFTTVGGQPVPTDTPIEWKTLERSNVDMVKEMTDMMASQRALQSAAQVLKMYDQLLGKATTEIGRV